MIRKLRDAVGLLCRMNAEVLASRMGWVEVTFTSRLNLGRGPGIYGMPDRTDPDLGLALHAVSKCTR